MTDPASTYVSGRLMEEVLTRAVRALPSLRTSLTDDDIKGVVSAHVKGLKAFTFRPGLDLRTLQEDIKDQIPTMSRKTKTGLETGYEEARTTIGDAYEIALNDIAAGLATSALRVVTRIRSELPEEVEALCDRIRSRTEAGAVDGTEPLEPATAFTWGRLSDPSFLMQVQNLCTERDRTWSRKTLEPRAAERLAAIALETPLPRVMEEKLLSTLEENMVQAGHAEAHEVLTTSKAHRKLTNGLEVVTDLRNRAGLYSLASYVSFLDTVLAGLEHAEKAVPDMEGKTQSLEDRIDILKTRVLLAYGACQVLRETVLSGSFIIPVPHDTTALLPKGSDLLFNEDLRSSCGIENPEMAVTEVYAYYHGSGIRVGPGGMTVDAYAKVRDRIAESLDSQAHVTDQSVRRQNVQAFRVALEEVLKNDVLTPCLDREDQNVHALIREHNAAIERIQFNMAHDADIRDELFDYKVRMEGDRPVSTFRTLLMRAIDATADESDDRRRDLSYVQAFSTFVTEFFQGGNLMQAT